MEHQSKPDALRAAVSRAQSQAAHPAEHLQRSWRARELDSKLEMLSQAHGAHAALKKRLECQVLGKAGRLPGLPSSRLGLEVLLNLHEDIDFDDFLGAGPDALPEREAIDMHLAMEQKLGMGPGAARPGPGGAKGHGEAVLSVERAVARGL